MRLPSGSRALRRRSSLPHSVAQRAPRDGTVGLWNPITGGPVRERGDKVFGELLCLFKIMHQTLPLPICVQLTLTYFLLDCMTSLLPFILAMFYLLFSWIKSCGKLLIYSTVLEGM